MIWKIKPFLVCFVLALTACGSDDEGEDPTSGTPVLGACNSGSEAASPGGDIDAFSLQWSINAWAPLNFDDTLPFSVPGWSVFAFENFSLPPIANTDILHFAFHTSDCNLTEVYLTYHNTGSNIGSINVPPQYDYFLKCNVDDCSGITFEPAQRSITIGSVQFPHIPGSVLGNNVATSPVNITGTLTW